MRTRSYLLLFTSLVLGLIVGCKEKDIEITAKIVNSTVVLSGSADWSNYPCTGGSGLTAEVPNWITIETVTAGREGDAPTWITVGAFTAAVDKFETTYECGAEFGQTGRLTISVEHDDSVEVVVDFEEEIPSFAIEAVYPDGSKVPHECLYDEKPCRYAVPRQARFFAQTAGSYVGTCATSCGALTADCSFDFLVRTEAISCFTEALAPQQSTLTISPFDKFEVTSTNENLKLVDRYVFRDEPSTAQLTYIGVLAQIQWMGDCRATATANVATVSLPTFGETYTCDPIITPIVPDGVPVNINSSGHVGDDTNNTLRLLSGMGVTCQDGVCTGMAEMDTVIRLEPVPDQNSAFDNWGACANQFSVDANNILTITVDASMTEITCVATFKEAGGCTSDVPVIAGVTVTSAASGVAAPTSGGAYQLVNGDEYRFVAELQGQGTLSWEVFGRGVYLDNGQGLDFTYSFNLGGGGATGRVELFASACDGTEGPRTVLDIETVD